MSSNSAAQTWADGPLLPDGPAEDIHVWQLRLNSPSSLLDRLKNNLSQDELDRAGRFRFQNHQRQYIAAHGCLRDILSRYLGIFPAQIDFETNAYGKPSLAKKYSSIGLTFNLTHSNEIGLVAVGNGRALGVDIEYIRPDLADEQIARRFFSEYEVADLLSLPADQRQIAFFTCWTRKEAYIKGRGEGLSMPLNQFDVSLRPDVPAALLQTRPDPAQALQWKLYALYPAQGYVAALAVEGAPGIVNCWHWSELKPR